MKAFAKLYDMNIKDKRLFRLLSKILLAVGSSCQPFFSDFRCESYGIFVLGVGFFFLQTNFDFLTCHF